MQNRFVHFGLPVPVAVPVGVPVRGCVSWILNYSKDAVKYFIQRSHTQAFGIPKLF